MSYLPTWPATPSATSSRESLDGPTLSGSPESAPIPRSGPDHAHASLSARQARERGLLTSGTYGPPSTGSSRSAVLSEFLGSRLRAVSERLGSTLYRQTWKVKATPSGRLLWRHVVSGRRTSASGCIGWPTPIDNDRRGSTHCYGKGVDENGDRIRYLKLPGVAKLAARDYRHANLKSYQDRSGTLKGEQLNNLVVHQLTDSGGTPSGSHARTASTGQLNPAHSRWLMSLPPSWCVAAILAHRALKARRKRGQ